MDPPDLDPSVFNAFMEAYILHLKAAETAVTDENDVTAEIGQSLDE
jgi:hypothetical protein